MMDVGALSKAKSFRKLPGLPYGHAWLMSDSSRVYDPVHNKEYSKADYAAEFNAIPLMTYSLKEALRTGAEQRHYGPWIWPPCGR